MFSHGAMSRRHTISSSLTGSTGASPSSSSGGGGGSGYYTGYGYAVERPSKNGSLWCSPGFDDTASHRKDKKTRRKQGLDVSDPWCIVVMAGLIMFAWAMHSRAQRAWILKELHVQTFEEALRVFQDLQTQHSMAVEDVEHHSAVAERLQKRDRAWKEQAEWLQNATKKESHRAVVDKYGQGPHLVHITVHFDGVGAEGPSDHIVAIELAPIKYVPHAVHFFLEQVSHGLWNHSAFHLNHHHVLQVGPSTPEHRDRFRDLELDRLAFPEYSPHFSHHKWTIGYAGRPGGPSWYVNKIDNRADHGPHGQEHHALNEYADSCFGRIVDGFDVLERVFLSHEHASISSASVVNWHEHWTEYNYDEWHKEHEDFHHDEFGEADSDDWFEGDDDRHLHPHGTHEGLTQGAHHHQNQHQHHKGTHSEHYQVAADSTGIAMHLHSPATQQQHHDAKGLHPTVEQQLKSYYSTQQTKQAHRHLKK